VGGGPNALALKYGRTKEHKADQRKIAEIAYGSRKELGNTQPSDGWNFRGKGLLQITGRSNYGEIQKVLDEIVPTSGVKIADGVDRSFTAKEAGLTGMADWYKDKMFVQADFTNKGKSDDAVVDAIVNIINRYTPSRPKRKVWYRGGSAGDLKVKKENSMKMVFKVDDCKSVPTKTKSNDKEEKAKWFNPLKGENRRTFYDFSGNAKPENGAFGPVRRKADGSPKNHQGLDIFAKPGTICVACMDGDFEFKKGDNGSGSFGNVFAIKVKGEDIRKFKEENNYQLKFKQTGEAVSGNEFDINAEFVYLRYAHVYAELPPHIAERINNPKHPMNNKVKAGEVICCTDVTGNAGGTQSPHLHFEVANKGHNLSTGIGERFNPAYFIKGLDSYSDQELTALKAIQTEAKKKKWSYNSIKKAPW
jgi:murein DD-endopeptidase MepM/ murein hydrolase activator NlpD